MSILINLAAEFTGKKAFKEADTAIGRMEKSTKQLAKTLGVTLSAAAIGAYGKAAVKAFAEDEAATIRLTNAVNNLGFAFANSDITKFIAGLEATAGIADDKLRPAFQALLTTTKDLNASYKLLNDAIAISRGSGVDLATVAQDLANGYTGVTRGLRKYNTGLTQAELKSKSFADILGVLNSQFAGANQAYLDSYAYKLDVLTVASENAKETIGAGLIDAFARLGGGTEVQDAVRAIDNIAKAVNGVTMAVATVVGGFAKLFKALDFLTSFGGLTGANPKWATKEADKTAKAAATTAKVQYKASTALTKATKSNTAELKKQALAKKQSTLFDMEQIQIIAALKGNISKEEELRLKLQLALITGNEDQAKKLSDQLADSIDKTGKLKLYINTLPTAPNPFAAWDTFLDGVIAKARLAASIGGGGSNGGATIPPQTNVPPQGSIPPSGSDAWAKGQSWWREGGFGSTSAPVVVQIDGKTIASALMDQSLSGNQAYVNRRTGGFE
jgi:hypothetical protein